MVKRQAFNGSKIVQGDTTVNLFHQRIATITTRTGVRLEALFTFESISAASNFQEWLLEQGIEKNKIRVSPNPYSALTGYWLCRVKDCSTEIVVKLVNQPQLFEQLSQPKPSSA